MKPICIFFLVVGTIHCFFAQTSYYVDQANGSSTSNGLTLGNAFESVDDAISVLLPGDTVFIVGMYTNSSYNPNYSYTAANDPQLWKSGNTIQINNVNGSTSGYITFKSYNNSALLKGDGSNIFRVQNSSYLRIEGFEIEGEVNSIPLSTANALQFAYINTATIVDPTTPLLSDILFRDEDCVSNCTPNAVVVGEIYSDISNLNINRPSYIDTRGMYLSNVHHIDILNNHIHHMPGGGLRVAECEDILISGNEVNDCSRRSYSGTHGLVVTKAQSSRTTDDYRITISRNSVHHNYNEQYSWAPSKTIITPHIDEGKGISLQRNETTYDSNNAIVINWEDGRILIVNNLCYFNGFSGVHSNDGNRIDFIHNTSYFNSYTQSITEGITSSNGGNIGISAQGGSDIRMINNISVIDAGLSKSALSSNLSAAEGLIVENNMIYGTNLLGVTSSISEDADIVAVQVNTLMKDPLFIDPQNFDFHLEPTSLAIGHAAANFSPADDYFGTLRDLTPDAGAIEYLSLVNVDENILSGVSFYPNPFNDILYVDNQTDALGKVSIFDMLGRDFTRLVSFDNNSLNTSQLPSGVYYIRVNTTVQKLNKE